MKTEVCEEAAVVCRRERTAGVERSSLLGILTEYERREYNVAARK